MGVPAFLDEQLNPASIEDDQCERLIRHQFDELSDPAGHLLPHPAQSEDALRQLFPALADYGSGSVGDLYEFREATLLNDLSRATLLRATYSRRQLYEQMVHFWTDHFNIDPSKGEAKWLKVADDREVIRKHALGKFADLLRASALSPAMLWYLDGRVNRRSGPSEKPNENYARELMELHTMGVHGGYTQEDVMEVARCLTGWTVRDKKRLQKGRVEFNPKEHDDGTKLVLGETIPAGPRHRRSRPRARHRSAASCHRALHRRQALPALHCRRAARRCRGRDGRCFHRQRRRHSVRLCARSSPRRSSRRAAPANSSGPSTFVVSALRATNAATDAGKPVLDALLRMGHAPFRYPTPDGYPEEASHWTGTLLWRWNFAAALADNRLAGTKIKPSRTAIRAGRRSRALRHLPWPSPDPG